LKGLKTLQDVGLCHRNLSLDAISIDRDYIDICELGWALRFNKNAPADEDRPLPPPGGSDPKYVAPEYFGSLKGSWNGFGADLWAAGLMLYTMIFGTDSLFAAPIAEDRIFARLCIKGDVRGLAKRYGKLVGKDFSSLSDDLIDLLTNMLAADPKQRLSLEHAMEHPWLTSTDVVSPTEWISKNRSDLLKDESSGRPLEAGNESKAG
jgi:serine/threonine protein kinase